MTDASVNDGECRACGGATGEALVAYGELPVSGCYVRADRADADPCRPFTVVRCGRCGLVQLAEALEVGFYDDYRFMGDVGAGYSAHLGEVARWIGACGAPGASIVEVGASNGALLTLLAEQGARVAGYEPAVDPARKAQERGLDVRIEPLTPETAAPFANQADVIVIRHVLEHIQDLPTFLAGVEALAHEGTRLVVEVPDLAATVRVGLHTNFYHPHLSYFDEQTLGALLAGAGWRVDVTRVVDIFGGSLLVGASRQAAPAPQWAEPPGVPYAPLEEGALEAFLASWRERAEALRGFLEAQAAAGKVVDGYGAAERTVAALGYAGVAPGHVRRLYDRNPLLWGWCVPGSRIPIASAEAIPADPPDLMILFASSHEREIMAQQREFVERGGRFVSVRGPHPRIIDASC
ncbi:MAG: hypothetical protein CMH57_08815 [Myxococcales bacterium]|nr:hypothetical protein [Myxococcales bacterium]